MKKLFTLVFAAFAAVSVFAQSRTTLWEGEQTMDAGWPNVEVSLSNLTTAKAGDYIVVTTSKVDASINASWEWGGQVFLKVNSGANNGWEDMAGTSAVGFKEPGEAKFEITDKILEQFKKATNFYVQGMCVVVSKVEFESSVATTSSQIWSGECVFGSWESGFSVPAEKFANASAGDVLEFVYTTDPETTEKWWQFKTIFAGTQEALSSNKSDLNEYDCATVASGSTSYKIVLNAEDIAKLKVTGLFVNGHYNIVTAVNLIQPVKDPSTGINNALVAPAARNAKVYNLAGQQVNASYKGVVIQNGKKYVQK